MNLVEAIAIGLKKAQAGVKKVTFTPSPRRSLEWGIKSWEGHKAFQNIGTEDIFKKYLPDIEAGKLILGPAFWLGANDEIKISDNAVGLYSPQEN